MKENLLGQARLNWYYDHGSVREPKDMQMLGSDIVLVKQKSLKFTRNKPAVCVLQPQILSNATLFFVSG